MSSIYSSDTSGIQVGQYIDQPVTGLPAATIVAFVMIGLHVVIERSSLCGVNLAGLVISKQRLAVIVSWLFAIIYTIIVKIFII